MRRTVVLLVAVGAVLSLPARALATDHVVLSIKPARLAAHGPLHAWSLSGTTVDSAFAPLTSSRELFGVTLQRRFSSGRAEERHAFRAAPADSLSFDGTHGRWQARFGTGVVVRMTIDATGPPQPVSELLGCRGGFVGVPATLRGTFSLATRTKAFKTVRRTRLAATVTYNPSGAVTCAPADAGACTPSTSFAAARGTDAQLLASADSGGWMSLSFADSRSRGVDDSVWYHVMTLTGFDPFAGGLPSFAVRSPAGLPIRGTGVFTATKTSTAEQGSCRATTATGTFDGVFRTRFTGWGARTFASPASALYSESR